MTVTGNQPCHCAFASFEVYNSTNDLLFYRTVTLPDTPSFTAPTPPSESGSPCPATRGAVGIPAYIKMSILYSAHYDIVVTRKPRPGYNIGGTDFTNATVVQMGATLAGSLHKAEPGQFYKIHLDAGQTIFASGQVTASMSPGSSFTIDLLDANQTWLRTLYYSSGLYGTKVFPASGTTPVFYTNSGAAADFFVKVKQGAYMVQDFQFAIGPMVSGPTTVWWFGGAAPSRYATAITLKSFGGAGTTWSVTAGADKINLSTTTGSETIVTSSGTAFSAQVEDIRVTATAWGMTTTYKLTSRTPYNLLPAGPHTFCDTTYGYVTHVAYAIIDQLDIPLPSNVEVNEQWTTDVVNEYPDPPGTNWARGPALGWTTFEANLDDMLSGPPLGGAPVPVPTCDENPQPVQHWGQAFRIGSETIGVGKLVQTDTIQAYLSKSLHTNVVSPPQ